MTNLYDASFQVFKNCVLCGNNIFINIGKGGSGIISHPQIVKCKKCKLLFTNPIRKQSSLNALYNNFNEKYESSLYFNREKITSQATYFLKKCKNISTKPKFLNIGSANGNVNNVFCQVGWESFGIEPSKDLYENSKKNFPLIKVYHCTLEDADFKENSFDLIHFWHVIEHLKDPMISLDKIFYWLKPGGMLNLGTPCSNNILDLISQKFRKKYSLGYYHTFIFSKNNLAMALKKTGFDILEHKIYPSGNVKSSNGGFYSKIKYIISLIYPKAVSNMQKALVAKPL